MDPIVVIPARLAATRLPDKPLADIHGEPMIVHVWRRAMEAGLARVVVATDTPAIAEAIIAVGGEAAMTRADHASGSDRVFEAVEALDPARRHDPVINLQGDLPTIDPDSIRAVLQPFEAADGGAPLSDDGRGADVSSLVTEITEPAERDNPNVVKAAVAFPPGARSARALYFSRQAIPAGEGPLYHHIGLYGFRRDALARFVALPPGQLEEREKLEQLRALEAGMRIDVVLVDTVPLGVDTPEDLERARTLLPAG